MSDSLGLMSVEQVATALGVHVRTVRRYIHEGRLQATRIGKLYRIPTSQITSMTDRGAPAADPIARARHCEASTVVQIDAIDPEAAMRVVNGVGGAIKGRDKVSDTPLRVDTIYDENRARLKIIITGSLPTTVGLLKLVEAHAQMPS